MWMFKVSSTMFRSSTTLFILPFAFLGFFTAIASGGSLKDAKGGLAGAIKQYEERWKDAHERLSDNVEFLTFLEREKKKWKDFLTYFPIEPQGIHAIDKRAALIRDRSKWLNGILENPATPAEPEGLYWTAKGNSLRIKKIRGEFFFSLRKYEFTHGHQGVVAGALTEWKDGCASFTGDFSSFSDDPNVEYFPRKPQPEIGSVKFELRHGLIAVTASGAVTSIGGPRAHFDGVYSRVSKLKGKSLHIFNSDLKDHCPPKFKSPLE